MDQRKEHSTSRKTSVRGVDVRSTSIRLQFTGPDGTRHRITLKDAGGRALPPTVANVRAAERTITQIRSEIRAGVFNIGAHFPELAPAAPQKADERRTLAQQLNIWDAGLIVAPSTRVGYSAAIKFWKIAPANEDGLKLGDVYIDELVFSQIRHALAAGSSRNRRGKVDDDKPSKPLKPKTINNYLAVLRAALELAVDDSKITKNPAGEGSKLRSKVQEPEPDPLSREELDAVIARIRLKSEAAGDYCEFWGFTGMRTSEINGLRWESVDLRTGYVRVHEVNVRGEQLDRTKTSKVRDVRLTARALAALERQRARKQLAGGYVWTNPQDDKPWDDERDFRRSHWSPALKALGLRYRRPYQLRHTCATMLLIAGVNPAVAAKFLGHSQQMFFKRYARWIDGVAEAAELAKIDAVAVDRAVGSGAR